MSNKIRYNYLKQIKTNLITNQKSRIKNMKGRECQKEHSLSKREEIKQYKRKLSKNRKNITSIKTKNKIINKKI